MTHSRPRVPGDLREPSPVVVKRTIDAAIVLVLNGYATERLA
jgi:hypothetical protein